MRQNHPLLLLVTCGCLLFVVIIGAIAFLVNNFRHRALADTERELNNSALILAEQIDRSFQSLELVERSVQENIDALNIASEEEYRRLISSANFHRLLKDKIEGLTHVQALSLIDRDGNLLNFSRPWPVPEVNVADRDYFQALSADTQLAGSYISRPVRNRVNGAWAVYLARRLAAPNGTFRGLIIGAMELSYFEDYFASILLGEDSSISLVRDDGVLLIRYPRVESAIGATFTGSKDALGERNSGTSRFVGIIDGKERLLAAHRLRHYPLHVGVSQHVEAALAGWRSEVQVLLGAGILSAVAIGSMFLMIGRQLSRGDKLAKQRLALEKVRLDKAIENMSQGLLLFDSSEKIVVCNRRYIDMCDLSWEIVKPGLTFRELMRHRLESGSFSGDLEQYRDSLIRDLARGKESELVIQTTGGRWIRILNQPLADGGWVATHEDITERRLLEQERDRNREFLNLVIDTVPAMITVKNAQDGRYVLVNKLGAQYFGTRPEQIVGKTVQEVWPKEMADIIAAHDEHAKVGQADVL
jgi:PAS domain-containing protein